MATRRVTKKASKKASPKASPKKAPKKASPKEEVSGVQMVDPKDLDIRARPRRKSKFDPVAEALLKHPTKAVVISVPETSTSQVYRTMLYSRLKKCLDFIDAKHGKKVSINVLRSGQLGVTLVSA
jgi:hypothetical protein